MGLETLPDDPRFIDNDARVKHRTELSAILAPCFAKASTQELEDTFKAAKVPLSPIFDIAEAFAEQQSAARNLIWNMGGAMRLIANPLQHMSRTPARPASPPPELGQDARSVLCDDLGIAPEELAALIDGGVIGKPA
jgi:crotonobetainyl-CoA:carnitine CoA-transferase CaiB-like acyl-CoA transferase